MSVRFGITLLFLTPFLTPRRVEYGAVNRRFFFFPIHPHGMRAGPVQSDSKIFPGHPATAAERPPEKLSKAREREFFSGSGARMCRVGKRF
jgi:hypothetical protein